MFPVDLPARVGIHYFCFPHYARVGYVTLFVLACANHAEQTQNTKTLYILQRDSPYDADTLDTSKHLHMLYKVDATVEVVLPEEQKTDYALLSVLCHLVQSHDTQVLPADVIRSRDYAVRFCSGLLVKAAQSTTNSIEEL